MDAMPKGNMAIGFALNIEAIGIRELGLISVRRANPGHDYLTLLDALVANSCLGFRHPRHSFHWRVKSQGLLDGSRQQRSIVAQAFNYTRILVETDNHVSEQIGRCLVACDQQQAAKTKQLHVAQPLPIDLGGKQCTDKVVLWVLASFLKHLREVAIHALDLLEECPALFFR